MNLLDVREGLATAAGTYGGGDALDALSHVPDSIAGLTVAVGRMRLSYNRAFKGLQELEVTLHAFASRADTWQGQDDLLPLMAVDGLKASIEADRTLGGACDELRVETCDGPGLVDIAGTQFWGASWTVRVWG